jgi:hypothetical protein
MVGASWDDAEITPWGYVCLVNIFLHHPVFCRRCCVDWGSPARLVPHSVVYAASALPMGLPQNFHGQSARNDIHELKKLLHKCHTESTVAILKWIVLCNRLACPNSLVRNLLQQLRHKCGVTLHTCGVMRRGAEWCGVARNAVLRRNVKAFAALYGLFAYCGDLPHMPRC